LAESVLQPREWRLLRSALRTSLGLACLGVQFVVRTPDDPAWPFIATAVFALYALVALLWPRFYPVQASLAGLFFETIFFVVFTIYGGDRGAWLGSFFYLYLMIAAVVNHDWGDVFIVVGASLGVFMFVGPPSADVLRRVVLVTGLLACTLSFQKRRLQERIAQALRREDALHDEVEKVREAERQRIAGDFHDGPLQTFISIQVRLDILGTLLKRDHAAAVEDLKELQQLARSQVGEIRSFLRSMRPGEVDSSDLVPSVRRIVEYFQKDTGIAARFVSSEASLKLPPELTHEMLQILREALHNVQKHSKASRVVVGVEQSGRTVEVSVDDDGAGFSFSGSFNLEELDLLRLGPQSIKRRVRSLSGDLTIQSRPGHGAGVKIRVPVGELRIQ
jgi:signal transduction histidine kinase